MVTSPQTNAGPHPDLVYAFELALYVTESLLASADERLGCYAY